MQMKISSAKWRPFCPGGDELTNAFSNPHWQLDKPGAHPINDASIEFKIQPKNCRDVCKILSWSVEHILN